MTTPAVWRLRTRSLSLETTRIMGVVNITPDSFSDGGLYLDHHAAVERGLDLVAAGADLIDLGGESTRPGAAPVSADEESARVIPVVEELSAVGVAVSVDTTKPEVARAALQAGAEVINDVGGLRRPEMVEVVAGLGAGVVIMHMQGTPQTMQLDPSYQDVMAEVRAYLIEKAQAAEKAGVERRSICIDPGIGFGKNLYHNLVLINRLGELVAAGYPVGIGTSRKQFLGRLTGVEDASQRDLSTAVTVALAVERGASIVRVHDVGVCREAVTVAEAIVRELQE